MRRYIRQPKYRAKINKEISYAQKQMLQSLQCGIFWRLQIFDRTVFILRQTISQTEQYCDGERNDEHDKCEAACAIFRNVLIAVPPTAAWYPKFTTAKLTGLCRKRHYSINHCRCRILITGFRIIYDKTVANPTTTNVEEARELYLEKHCDAIIGFGGGSSIDCAKAVGARIAKPKQSLSKMKGILKVHKKLPLLVAIPTTAGTGSETTLAAVITDARTRHKYAINDFPLIPAYAVLDPKVTISLPPSLTATTGMDALTHAVEAYIGGSTTRHTRKYAKKATKLIFDNIYKAYDDGQNIEARKEMLKASFFAGCAFTKSYVGYVHAVAHSLGGKYNIPHGLANATILPMVLEDYGSTIYKKLYQLAVYAGIADESDDHAVAADKFISAIKDMKEYFQIGDTFSEIQKEDIRIELNTVSNRYWISGFQF